MAVSLLIFKCYDAFVQKVKEWIQNLGLGDHIPFVHDDDEPDDEPMHMHHDDSSSVKNRSVGNKN
jgi:phospholipase D1/2